MEKRALRLYFALALGLSIPVLPMLVSAPIASAQATDEEEEALEEEEAGADEEEPRLRAPQVEPLAIPPDEEGEEEEAVEEDVEEEDVEDEEIADEEAPAEDEELPSPESADERLDIGGNPTIEPWTTPQTVFELHGYMRMRGEFQDQFSLGRGRPSNATNEIDYPFELFIPRDDGSRAGDIPGGCRGGASTDPSACNQRALAFANMRLRLEPTIHLSDDVRVRMQVDVFDNLVMGSTPEGYGITSAGMRGYGLSGTRYTGSVYTPYTAVAGTQRPSSAGLNSWSDSIVVRRAWAEVRNRGLGELRFGRMGNHWGLGILANGGTGIDSDFQSDVDRIMAITRLVGFYFFGAWDFASEGYIYENPIDVRVPFDAVRNDDVDQFTFGVARRSTPEEQAAALQRGDAVLNAGLYFVYRTQNLTSEATPSPLDWGNEATYQPVLYRRGFEVYAPDVWVQFLFENLRLEAEASMLIGTIDNVQLPTLGDAAFSGPTHQILSFGFAFEGEYHLLNNQLGIYFNAGYASGDADVEGLTGTPGNGGIYGQDARGDRNLSAYAFHPNYRVDLIFWRTIMRQISSAYYFRPGISYDFIRSSFGQLLGARADVVWSRASEPVQTWGNQADLGVEIDAQVYYRSEDGPDLLDGFYASLQYGIFFPLAGLGYLGEGTAESTNPGLPHAGGQNAQTIRLILGVQY